MTPCRSVRDPLATPYLDPATIARVVAMPDPIARNHAITRGYHALSEAVAALLGRTDANWLTFGQWASAEAGRSIRGENLPGLARMLLGREVSAAVAAGNAAVFEDVAPPFARFIVVFRDDPAARTDPVRAAAVLERLSDDPQLAASEDLRRAFAAYVDALLLGADRSPEAAIRRARRMLVANVSVGAHEQIVADDHVRAAVPGRSIVAVAATATLQLTLPDGALRLSDDVPPPPYLDGAAFPAALIDLEDEDLLALAHRFGQDPSSAIHSDAPNWEDYRERMGFIFTFLRAWQQDPGLFALPPGTSRDDADASG